MGAKTSAGKSCMAFRYGQNKSRKTRPSASAFAGSSVDYYKSAWEMTGDDSTEDESKAVIDHTVKCDPERFAWVCVKDGYYGNDPSAGSPTETLLRLHLPLNDEV